MAKRGHKASAVPIVGLASIGEDAKKLKRIKQRTEKLLANPIDMRQLQYFLQYLKTQLGIEEAPKGE